MFRFDWLDRVSAFADSMRGRIAPNADPDDPAPRAATPPAEVEVEVEAIRRNVFTGRRTLAIGERCRVSPRQAGSLIGAGLVRPVSH